MLEGFKPFDFNEGVPYVSVTRNGVTFNKSVIMKLNYPKQVVLLINDEAHQIAVQVCPEDYPKAVSFYKEKKSKLVSVRWNGKDLLNTLQEMMNWNLEYQSYRIEGVLLKEENAMLFDLNSAKEITNYV